MYCPVVVRGRKFKTFEILRTSNEKHIYRSTTGARTLEGITRSEGRAWMGENDVVCHDISRTIYFRKYIDVHTRITSHSRTRDRAKVQPP